MRTPAVREMAGEAGLPAKLEGRGGSMAKEPPGATEVFAGTRSGRPNTQATYSAHGHQRPPSSSLIA